MLYRASKVALVGVVVVAAALGASCVGAMPQRPGASQGPLASPHAAADGLVGVGALRAFPPTRQGVFVVPTDHFGFSSNHTTALRVLEFDTWWKRDAETGEGTGPVLFYCGNEGDIHDFYNYTGIMFELAQDVGGLVVFVEHRYYGESLPFGPDASFTPAGLRFLTIEQALADFSLFLSDLPANVGCKAGNASCKVVLFGGSYGGMLAAWHRVKYPHLSEGALASGAPIDFYPGEGKQQQFYDATIATFEKYGNTTNCGQLVDQGLTLVSQMAKFASNLPALSSTFQTCSPMEDERGSGERLVFYLKGALSTLAMVDYPYASSFVAQLPPNPVTYACAKMAAAQPSDPHSLLAALNAATNVFVNATAALPCHNISAEVVGYGKAGATLHVGGLGGIEIAWNYQACTELILEPLTSDGLGFYAEDDDQVDSVVAYCRDRFGVFPRPAWIQRSTGGNSTRFLSNLILADNEKDPWHVGGVGESQSASVHVLFAEGGAHHQDLMFSSSADSQGVQAMRAREKEIVKGWLA